MRMELIQPFINAADAVLAETLKTPTRVTDMTMEPQVYNRHGAAALIEFSGDIEGRIIFDSEPATALKVAEQISGGPVEASEDLVCETVCELANLVIGNAITVLNDQGFHFKVHPPLVHSDARGFQGTEDVEALVMCFDTSAGIVNMNIAMRYNRRRHRDE
ncbi:MAG TPA: chemotaxis protein CheX [candidate division Zixibacteria bacterium]|nr:chemotaxis protein CheX [candidate division Zixibacteria bacterium]